MLAYACSSIVPDEPKNNASTFNVHEQFGIWEHDLKFAKNASFADWVKNNSYVAEVGIGKKTIKQVFKA